MSAAEQVWTYVAGVAGVLSGFLLFVSGDAMTGTLLIVFGTMVSDQVS